MLKNIAETVVHASQSPGLDGGPFKIDKSPWLDLGVTVIRGPFKGYYGSVKNVLLGQETVSGKRIEVQLSHIGGARPFALELFDYDHIVETR